MLDLEVFEIAFNNLKQQKLRSYLTLLGIVIGIAAIVALISLGQGLSDAVSGELEMLGMNTIYIEPGSEESMMTTMVARTIKERDLEIVEKIPGVKEVVPFYEGAGIMKRKDEAVGVLLLGIRPEQTDVLEEIGYMDIVKGRSIKPNDRYVAIIYDSFAENAFSDEMHIKERVEIHGKNFKIIGISKAPVIMMGISNMVIMTDEVVKELAGEESLVEVAVETVSRDDVSEVAERIEYELEREHGTKDFYLMTSENIVGAAGIILGLIQLILIGIASISLLVGGIGIMNTMLMSVIERTREIGVMKAIGAPTKTVLAIFLIEAGYIGMIGGIIGIIFGFSISLLISVAAAYSGFTLRIFIGPELAIGALAFSMIVGMVSGIIPARRAAKLEPTEALRYE